MISFSQASCRGSLLTVSKWINWQFEGPLQLRIIERVVSRGQGQYILREVTAVLISIFDSICVYLVKILKGVFK